MLTNLKIRLARPTDAEAIATLSRNEIEYDLHWGWTPSRVRKSITNQHTNVAVARDNGKLVGFGIMCYYRDVAHLLLFAVRPGMKRKGVGSALLQWLEQVALVAGITKIRLEARAYNAPAIAFYLKHGYHQIHYIEDMYQGAEDGVCFEKMIVKENPSCAELKRIITCNALYQPGFK